MAKRKTFSVKKLVAEINRRNKESTCSAEVRQGWNAILESILHETGNYHGFNYYNEEDIPNCYNKKPGIRTETDIYGAVIPCMDYKKRFQDTDNTRIFFYWID